MTSQQRQIVPFKDLKRAKKELQMSIPAPIYTEEQNLITDEIKADSEK